MKSIIKVWAIAVAATAGLTFSHLGFAASHGDLSSAPQFYVSCGPLNNSAGNVAEGYVAEGPVNDGYFSVYFPEPISQSLVFNNINYGLDNRAFWESITYGTRSDWYAPGFLSLVGPYVLASESIQHLVFLTTINFRVQDCTSDLEKHTFHCEATQVFDRNFNANPKIEKISIQSAFGPMNRMQFKPGDVITEITDQNIDQFEHQLYDGTTLKISFRSQGQDHEFTLATRLKTGSSNSGCSYSR